MGNLTSMECGLIKILTKPLSADRLWAVGWRPWFQVLAPTLTPLHPYPHRVLEPFLMLLPKTLCVELCWCRLFALRATVRWVRLGPDRSVRAPTFDPWAGRGGWGGGLGGVPGGVAHARIGWASSGPALPPRASVFCCGWRPGQVDLGRLSIRGSPATGVDSDRPALPAFYP